MTTQFYMEALLEKASELKQQTVSKDQIAIERNADLFDHIQRTTEREMALQFLNRNWAVSTQVAQALDRIAEGSYGICAECDGPIGERRLRAIPWVSLCIRCQEQADRNESTIDSLDYQQAA